MDNVHNNTKYFVHTLEVQIQNDIRWKLFLPGDMALFYDDVDYEWRVFVIEGLSYVDREKKQYQAN